MREMNRRMVAQAKSHRASPEDLREVKKRIKEIEEEMRQVELQEATKRGEDREQRYERMVRLRELREDFLETVAAAEPPRPNSLLLALVMFVSSFLLCAFCAFSGYFGLTLLNQTPDPTASAATFWTAVEQGQYGTVENVLFAPALRAKIPVDTLITIATTADKQFGKVDTVTLTSQSGASKSAINLNYRVTRISDNGKKTIYDTTLQMLLLNRNWVIGDPGAALAPTLAGKTAPTAPPSTSPTPAATSTP